MTEKVDRATISQTTRRRADHRTKVTKLVNELVKVITLGDTGRLRQIRQSLRDKIEILSCLDEQILSMIKDDLVESEIEQAEREG